MPKSKKTETAVTPYNWGDEENTGFENTRQEDLGIPFLVVLQKGSAEVDPDHKDYATKEIEGAESGDVMNTQNREVIWAQGDDPLQFIPSSYMKLYQEWRPRNSGGGFVKSHGSQEILGSCKRSEKNEDVLPNGNIIITTAYFYGQYWDGEEWKQAILPMTSTQLKKARGWLNKATAIKIDGKMPPLFSHIYNLTTVPESNEKGNWKGWKVELNRILTVSESDVIESARHIAGEAQKQNLLSAPAPESENTPY